ncbi:MAG: LutB/LldF family L-lactate oxidation iron-sulfur protein [Candidatus Thiodiazotropha sp.]
MQRNADFHTRTEEALANAQLKASLRSAMDGLMASRKACFPDADAFERLRLRGAQIRVNALSKLPQLLELLERNCTRNGIRVHWAESVDEANETVLGIMREHQAALLIKGKSMVSEEMDLNRFLESHGIECLESDLGEYILQLAGEPPSHIVAPAIHKTRQDIAKLFKQKFPDIPYSEDVDTLTRNARGILRKKFHAASVGLSGVNFAVAESGTLCLVENEGNGRMCTTVPPVHIAVTGIEKVVEKLEHIPPLLKLLTRSATGQRITTYFNMISSPRKTGEKDGPKEVHLILLDNGRSRIYEDEELVNTLRCIRCGACMNHCPIYTRIGGHAYGTTIPGPIGSVLEPQKAGLKSLGELPVASTLCGACAEVCPVRIPIPRLLNRLRFERIRNDHVGTTRGQGSSRTFNEAIAWKAWSWLHRNPVGYRLAMTLVTRLRNILPLGIGPWTQARKAPRIAAKTLHQRAREEGFNDQ